MYEVGCQFGCVPRTQIPVASLIEVSYWPAPMWGWSELASHPQAVDAAGGKSARD
jgi:hypothetical protein